MKQFLKVCFISVILFIPFTNVSAKSYGLDTSWQYADFSVIHSGKSTLYESSSNKKDIIVAINAGHGTSNVNGKKTYCHPDKSAKVTGGTTAAGETMAVAVSSGMEFQDGTSEAVVTLKVAQKLKSKLLSEGYDVLMIRNGSDVQLDNVARTVIANNIAEMHIAIHFDSTSNDKGAFYMSVPNNDSYRSMSPVSSYWQSHHELGDALISGLKQSGVKIYSSGSMPMDLTQTSFSTIPSVDIELGDKKSDISDAAIDKYADGLLNGILEYSGESRITPITNPTDPGDSSDDEDDSSDDENDSEDDDENNSSDNSNESNGGAAEDWGDQVGDQSPIEIADPSEGCETIFKNSDGSFNELGQFMQDLFTLIKFAAPVLVIALSTVDYAKALSAQNADEMKKAHIKFGKRLILGVAVFLLPFILDLMFELFGLYGLDTCGIR